MRIKALVYLLLLGALALSIQGTAWARKKLPARKPVVSSTVTAGNGLPSSQLKLRDDKLALLLKLTNLSEAESISYSLTYTGGQVPQGVEGSLDPSIGSTQKELVFGTCSGAVCTYHQEISGMSFRLTIGLKSGKTLVRKYQIKI